VEVEVEVGVGVGAGDDGASDLAEAADGDAVFQLRNAAGCAACEVSPLPVLIPKQL
jgi:hypothetical protein